MFVFAVIVVLILPVMVKKTYKQTKKEKQLSQKCYWSTILLSPAFMTHTQLMSKRTTFKTHASELKFLCRVATFSLRTMLRSTISQSKAVLTHSNESDEVVQISIEKPSWSPRFGGFPSEKRPPGQTQNLIERICILAGLGRAGDPPRRS